MAIIKKKPNSYTPEHINLPKDLPISLIFFGVYANKLANLLAVGYNLIIFDRLWKTMKRKVITQYNLYKDYGISRAQVQRLKKNESVTPHTLDILCRILDYKLSDIAEYRKGE